MTQVEEAPRSRDTQTARAALLALYDLAQAESGRRFRLRAPEPSDTIEVQVLRTGDRASVILMKALGDPELAAEAIAEPNGAASIGAELTERQLTVLRLMARGATDKQIASELGISPFTASKHVANILVRMNVATRTEASVVALQTGLIEFAHE